MIALFFSPLHFRLVLHRLLLDVWTNSLTCSDFHFLSHHSFTSALSYIDSHSFHPPLKHHRRRRTLCWDFRWTFSQRTFCYYRHLAALGVFTLRVCATSMEQRHFSTTTIAGPDYNVYRSVCQSPFSCLSLCSSCCWQKSSHRQVWSFLF